MGTTEESEVEQQSVSGRTQALFVIAFLGSVDDLTLFVPMLAGKGFDLAELMAGGFIAASVIVLVCVFVGLCKPVADFLSSVPLVAIVVTFASILLVKGFNMDGGDGRSSRSRRSLGRVNFFRPLACARFSCRACEANGGIPARVQKPSPHRCSSRPSQERSNAILFHHCTGCGPRRSFTASPASHG